ncbi:MAG: HIT family protein [Rhodobacteraceae bacterium]|nr:HIT family protein [Paracoccaceae bacterium]
MPPYDADNIFAKILRGEIPSLKVFEDAQTYAFMDIMPRSDGHCLVIPKTACRNMLDATPLQLSCCLATVQRMGQALMRAFAAPGLTVQQFNEAAGGQEVFHLHYHVLPRYEGVALRPPGQMADMAVLGAQADRIRTALAAGGSGGSSGSGR